MPLLKVDKCDLIYYPLNINRVEYDCEEERRETKTKLLVMNFLICDVIEFPLFNAGSMIYSLQNTSLDAVDIEFRSIILKNK